MDRLWQKCFQDQNTLAYCRCNKTVLSKLPLDFWKELPSPQEPILTGRTLVCLPKMARSEPSQFFFLLTKRCGLLDQYGSWLESGERGWTCLLRCKVEKAKFYKYFFPPNLLTPSRKPSQLRY